MRRLWKRLWLGSKWNKVINVLLGADQGIKMNSERLHVISTDQCTFSDTKEAWLRFCPLNSHTIKSLGMEWSSDQGWFSTIKILDPSCKCFYRQCVCDYTLANHQLQHRDTQQGISLHHTNSLLPRLPWEGWVFGSETTNTTTTFIW